MASPHPYTEPAPEANGFHVFTPYDEAWIKRVRTEVRGAKWRPKLRAWFIPQSNGWRICLITHDVFSYCLGLCDKATGKKREPTPEDVMDWNFFGTAGERQRTYRTRFERDGGPPPKPPKAKPPKPRTPAIDANHRTLWVIPGAPPEVVKAAYRALSLLYHPDRGGDPEKMQTLNLAYEAVTKKTGGWKP